MPIFLFTIFILSLPIGAESRLQSSIHHLEMGEQMDEPALVYLSNGRVVRVNPHRLDLLEEIHSGVQNKKKMRFSIDDAGEVRDLKVLGDTQRKQNISSKATSSEIYRPSILGEMATAKDFFRESMLNPKDSQCYNRAHVWSHEWRIKHDLYSNKIWLFFTRKYIRQYSFDWWFHVSPYVHVVEDQKVRERVMDIKYAREPIKIKQWTNIFMKDGASCPIVEKFSDYANYPEWGSCFLMKTSMYYYQPVDMEWKELYGQERTTWIPAEIIEAYQEAFDINLKRNRRLIK